MTTCITLPFDMSIRHVDDPNIDVWKYETGTTDTTVKGEALHSPEIRKSTSILNKFSLTYVSDKLQIFFTKNRLEIGTGSKHIYTEGCFLKEHYDTPLEDKDGLPHIMTLMVTNSVKNLKVNGKPVKEIFYDYSCVIFSINCPHEVTTIPSGCKRQSFVFPIYGVYDPQNTIAKQITTTNLINKYDTILNIINDKIANDDFDSIDKLHAYIKMIDDRYVNSIICKLRRICDEYYEFDSDNDDSEHKSYYKISYRLKDDTTVIDQFMSAIVNLSDVTNIEISPVDYKNTLLLNIRDKLTQLKQEDEEEYKSSINTELDHSVKSELNDDIIRLSDDTPCIIILNGRYFKDTDNLITIDKFVYDQLLLLKHTVTFIPNAEIEPNFIVKTLYVTAEGLFNEDNHRVEQLPNVNFSKFSVEFNGYDFDSRFTLNKGVLIVS